MAAICLVWYVTAISHHLKSIELTMSLDVQMISPLGSKFQSYLILPDANQADSNDAKTIAPYFDAPYLQSNDLITKTASGRGIVYFFNLQENEVVLRHYYRGGLVAKLSRDKFIFAGLPNTRAYREMGILDYLHGAGISVPKPIAARVRLSGLTYQADIICEAIQQARELHELLQDAEVDSKIWRNIGTELAKLHLAQACHDDVNVKNILVKNDHSVVLLDFDGCRKKSGDSWKPSNLARFRRSLEKQQAQQKQYHFSEAQWQIALEAYSDFLSGQKE